MRSKLRRFSVSSRCSWVVLKAGQLADDKTKLFNWMEMPVWLNLKALSKHKFPQDSQAFFKALPDQIQRAEQTW